MKVRLVWGASRVTKMLTLLSAASLCTCIVGARAARAEGEQREPAVTISELEQRLEAIRKESGIPGVSVAIVRRHGVEWAGGARCRHRRHGATRDGGHVVSNGLDQ